MFDEVRDLRRTPHLRFGPSHDHALVPLQIFHDFDHFKAPLAKKFLDSLSLPGAKLQRHKTRGRQYTLGIHDQAADNFESILTRRKRAYGLKVSDLLGQ